MGSDALAAVRVFTTSIRRFDSDQAPLSTRTTYEVLGHIIPRRFPPYARRPSLVPRARDVHRRNRSCREHFGGRRRVYEAQLQRAHDRAEVWPHVEISTFRSEERRVGKECRFGWSA